MSGLMRRRVEAESPAEAIHGMGRRSFLAVTGAAFLGAACRASGSRVGALAAETPGPGGDVTIVEFTDAGKKLRTVTVPMVVKSEAEWQKQLSPASFQVTRHEGTERPFTGDLLNVHDAGVFRCICCDTALFDSKTKFESGTGWPSFWDADCAGECAGDPG